MSDSCGCTIDPGGVLPQSRSEAGLRITCPACGSPGRKVPGQTVKALLTVSLRNVLEGEYRFCPNASCEVVYFSANGECLFTRGQIRERVFQKEPQAENVLVCYCFRFTRGEVSTAPPDEQARIVAEINAGVQAGQCACDLRNPQGSCCLGNVRELIRRTRQAQGEGAGSAPRPGSG